MAAAATTTTTTTTTTDINNVSRHGRVAYVACFVATVVATDNQVRTAAKIEVVPIIVRKYVHAHKVAIVTLDETTTAVAVAVVATTK